MGYWLENLSRGSSFALLLLHRCDKMRAELKLCASRLVILSVNDLMVLMDLND